MYITAFHAMSSMSVKYSFITRWLRLLWNVFFIPTSLFRSKGKEGEGREVKEEASGKGIIFPMLKT